MIDFEAVVTQACLELSDVSRWIEMQMRRDAGDRVNTDVMAEIRRLASEMTEQIYALKHCA